MSGRPLPPAEKSVSLPMVGGLSGPAAAGRRRCCSLTAAAPPPPPLRHKQSRLRLELYERLQSHHSSSDEDWFEEVDEVDADAESVADSVARSQSDARSDPYPLLNRVQGSNSDAKVDKGSAAVGGGSVHSVLQKLPAGGAGASGVEDAGNEVVNGGAVDSCRVQMKPQQSPKAAGTCCPQCALV